MNNSCNIHRQHIILRLYATFVYSTNYNGKIIAKIVKRLWFVMLLSRPLFRSVANFPSMGHVLDTLKILSHTRNRNWFLVRNRSLTFRSVKSFFIISKPPNHGRNGRNDTKATESCWLQTMSIQLVDGWEFDNFEEENLI